MSSRTELFHGGEWKTHKYITKYKSKKSGKTVYVYDVGESPSKSSKKANPVVDKVNRFLDKWADTRITTTNPYTGKQESTKVEKGELSKMLDGVVSKGKSFVEKNFKSTRETKTYTLYK